jgi:hypothetical protein
MILIVVQISDRNAGIVDHNGLPCIPLLAEPLFLVLWRIGQNE